MFTVLVLDVSGWTALVVVAMRMTYTAVFSMTGVFTHALTHRMSLSRALQLNLRIYSVSVNIMSNFNRKKLQLNTVTGNPMLVS